MGFVDVEGDGILEIRNLSYYDGSEVWSWNGSEYGQWLNTPVAPPTELYPANNFTPHIECFVTPQMDTLIYNYSVQNYAQSKQRINLFWVEADVDESNLKKETPAHWQSSGYANNLDGWGAPTLNNGYLIWPGDSESGFKFITTGVPTIATYTTQAYNSAPSTDSMSSSEALAIYELNRTENMVWGETIGPREPDDTLNFEGFLDTLLINTERSLELGWITNQVTADKFDSLFTLAKTLLEGNHIPWVEYTLQSVIEECNADSSGNITSEAYALLRYNTEYLLENLPEIIPPMLNSISPKITIMPEFEATPYYAPEFDFTLTLTGDFFTDSSIIYFNNEQMETTFISDSIVTCHINETYISAITAGDYSVWVSNYGFKSDTLLLTSVDNLPDSIIPVLNCVQDNGDGNYTAWLGYISDNSTSVHIGYGEKNMFWPCTETFLINRGQPNIFLPGEHNFVFTIEFSTTSSPPCADYYKWILDSGDVNAADTKADECEEE